MNTLTVLFASLVFLLSAASAHPWSNGQSGNASTNLPEECVSPPYSTHDWIAEQALLLLPTEESAWLTPHRTTYLLGTEAPDNDNIPPECSTPNSGYDDRRKGHSVTWESDGSGFLVVEDKKHDRAAVRAQEEYYRAAIAYLDGDNNAAAYYLGAMAHYIGDVSQYGHSISNERHHSDYERWVGNRTKSATHGIFESYLTLDNLVRRTPYTAVKRISKATALGQGAILPASVMDASYTNRDQAFEDSIGASLNKGVNELADVLHRFYLSYVIVNSN